MTIRSVVEKWGCLEYSNKWKTKVFTACNHVTVESLESLIKALEDEVKCAFISLAIYYQLEIIEKKLIGKEAK